MRLFPGFKRLFFIFTVLFFTAFSRLSAAPLESGYAMAPGVSASAEEKALAFLDARNRVLRAAEKYKGTPYRYGGIDRNGLDCSGFVYVSFKDALGVSLPRSTTGLYAWVEKIPDAKAQPGDLLFFKTDNTGNISHVAIYIGDNRIIHSASAGPQTGVIYSDLNEQYWSRAYAGAGRAFPEVSANYQPVLAGAASGAPGTTSQETAAQGTGAGSGWTVVRPGEDTPAKEDVSSEKSASSLLLGFAIAPTWNGFLKDGELFRGFASQLRMGIETNRFGPRMVFGMEIRQEYDGALGVFRLPFTLSWGPSEKILIFAGPVLSFGDAALSVGGEKRKYSGGTSWLGAAGLTAAPFIFNAAKGELAPYFEAAWQSYLRDNSDRNPNADFSAGFRFSTGIRWSWRVR